MMAKTTSGISGENPTPDGDDSNMADLRSSGLREQQIMNLLKSRLETVLLEEQGDFVPAPKKRLFQKTSRKVEWSETTRTSERRSALIRAGADPSLEPLLPLNRSLRARLMENGKVFATMELHYLCDYAGLLAGQGGMVSPAHVSAILDSANAAGVDRLAIAGLLPAEMALPENVAVIRQGTAGEWIYQDQSPEGALSPLFYPGSDSELLIQLSDELGRLGTCLVEDVVSTTGLPPAMLRYLSSQLTTHELRENYREGHDFFFPKSKNS